MRKSCGVLKRRFTMRLTWSISIISAVRPAHGRLGVGSALIGAVRAAASNAGIALVALDVWTFNGKARAFFRRHGFEPYNERMWSR